MTTLLSLLNNTFDVYQLSTTSDDQGGHTESYAQIGSVPGRMSRNSGSDVDTADNQKWLASHRLYVSGTDSVGVQIKRKDLIMLGSETWEVQGVLNPSLLNHHLEIDCEYWQPN